MSALINSNKNAAIIVIETFGPKRLYSVIYFFLGINMMRKILLGKINFLISSTHFMISILFVVAFNNATTNKLNLGNGSYLP